MRIRSACVLPASSAYVSPMGRFSGSDAAHAASNWRIVLAVDLALGLVVVASGIILLVSGTAVFGTILGGVGILYSANVIRRALRWKRLRARRGLG